MIRGPIGSISASLSIPRESGDDPLLYEAFSAWSPYSPRERG